MRTSKGLADALRGRGIVGAQYQIRERIPLREYEECELPADIIKSDGSFDLYEDVQNRFTIEYKAKKRRLYLRADRWVGHIPLNDRYVLDVDTRVPVENIERILSRTSSKKPEVIRHTHAYHTTPDRPRNLLDILTDQFLHALDLVRSDGLLKQYVRRTAVSASPFGKIDPYRTAVISGTKGAPTASYSMFARTEDTAPNRIIRLALERLTVDYRRYDANDEAGRSARLGNAYVHFDHVGRPTAAELTPTAFASYVDRLPRHRESYVDALRLAYLVIADMGLALRGEGGVAILPAILIDMSDVFESYARSVLRRALNNGTRKVLDGNIEGDNGAKTKLFDPFALSTSNPPITPDIVIQSGAQAELVIDAKYKELKGLRDRSELNQVVCYGERYGCRKVMLLYPTASPHQQRIIFVGNVGEIAFYQGTFDLGAERLDEEEIAFAADVQALLGDSDHSQAFETEAVTPAEPSSR